MAAPMAGPPHVAQSHAAGIGCAEVEIDAVADHVDGVRPAVRLQHHLNVLVQHTFGPPEAVLDPERATLTYANAGHVPPLLFRARTGEVVSRLTNDLGAEAGVLGWW